MSRVPPKPVLGDVAGVAHIITGHEQTHIYMWCGVIYGYSRYI